MDLPHMGKEGMKKEGAVGSLGIKKIFFGVWDYSTVTFWGAMGGVESGDTVIVVVAWPVAPSSSVTVSVTVYCVSDDTRAYV